VDRIQDIGLAPAVRSYEAIDLPLKVKGLRLVVFEVKKLYRSEKQSVPKVLKRRHFDATLIYIPLAQMAMVRQVFRLWSHIPEGASRGQVAMFFD
jgi:hypothetical protein